MIYKYPNDKYEIEKRLKKRKELYNPKLIDSIRKIFLLVKEKGDKSILNLTKKYDNTNLPYLKLPDDYILKCVKESPIELKKAIGIAKTNIEQVNSYLLQKTIVTTEIRPGTIIGEKITPLNSVGLYVPARKGPLISTALMLIGAAKAAKVENIIVVMAPNIHGQADPSTVTAAYLAGANEIIVGNGVGLIAGLTFGTHSIPEVDGIFGPGPGGIAVAMSIAFSFGKKTVLGIGPTDSVIFCDDTAKPELLVHDLINEAEHGRDSCSILITTSEIIAKETYNLFEKVIKKIPAKRKEILQHVFSERGYGSIIICDSIDDAVDFIDDFAPEHMNVTCNSKNEKYILDKVKNVGEILLGEYTPFSAGNYVIGITAVLPTNGYARNISGITSKDMVKISTIGKLDRDALLNLLPTIQEIGKYEGLPSHVLAAEQRFKLK